jgi:uncharacterized Zn-binding protein involved in type VI secretion
MTGLRGQKRSRKVRLVASSGEGRSLEGKAVACGGDLTGTGNSLVKSQGDRKKGGAAWLQPVS